MGSNLLHRAVGSATRRLADWLGYDLVARNYFSPIPHVDELADSTWNEPSPLVGIEFDTQRQLAYLERDLAPLISEFYSPAGPGGGRNGFRLDNVSYGPVDAEILYATVRRWRPRRMLEVGSGWSTLVSAAACAQNAHDGHPAELVAIDPFPGAMLAYPIEGLSQLERLRAQEIPAEYFSRLSDGDILFIDTTHTVKTGGDVNRLVLEVLPAIAPGVLVHVHDIFLPWEYPRDWIQYRSYYWSEQYLIQAYLSGNPDWEVLLAAHHLVRAAPERVRESIPSLHPSAGGALWIRRRTA